jgi:hypothetical protein
MNVLKSGITKIVLGAVLVFTLSTMLSNTASATRYAVAYGEFVQGCGDTPGDPCPKN